MTTTLTAALSPYRFFEATVARTRQVGPSTRRVTFVGADLEHFASLGLDQSLSVFLPRPGQSDPVLPREHGDGWWAAFRAIDEDERAVMRSYTLREFRRAPGRPEEIDIDFVLHGDLGPASRWAAQAAPGHRVVVLGPRVADNGAVRFRLPAHADSVVIWADETALPAAESVLAALPPGIAADVWIDVPRIGDRRPLYTAADARIAWLVGEEAPEARRGERALAALRAAPRRGTRPYAWLSGESGAVTSLRRLLVRERNVPKCDVTFVGYWRHGTTEEELRARRAAEARTA
ncbi:siderophore-interacting protein [Streptomyces fuscigenes]|uniref:siderophore-interacting protein n=1 Tax=Streptomyces fuscigenes TaxID=1528880 RepID=UPI001F344382|nr:siderophore-interacting protein [Streptomyces fuscigenes]MCF3964055.1 siderophore-interacting protein [Streptomyces fuscigenes]